MFRSVVHGTGARNLRCGMNFSDLTGQPPEPYAQQSRSQENNRAGPEADMINADRYFGLDDQAHEVTQTNQRGEHARHAKSELR